MNRLFEMDSPETVKALLAQIEDSYVLTETDRQTLRSMLTELTRLKSGGAPPSEIQRHSNAINRTIDDLKINPD